MPPPPPLAHHRPQNPCHHALHGACPLPCGPPPPGQPGNDAAGPARLSRASQNLCAVTAVRSRPLAMAMQVESARPSPSWGGLPEGRGTLRGPRHCENYTRPEPCNGRSHELGKGSHKGHPSAAPPLSSIMAPVQRRLAWLGMVQRLNILVSKTNDEGNDGVPPRLHLARAFTSAPVPPSVGRGIV